MNAVCCYVKGSIFKVRDERDCILIIPLSYLETQIWVGNPSQPPCTCSNQDYKIEHIEDELYYVCICGKKYIKKNRVFYIVENGIKKPYMKWIPFKKWEQI